MLRKMSCAECKYAKSRLDTTPPTQNETLLDPYEPHTRLMRPLNPYSSPAHCSGVVSRTTMIMKRLYGFHDSDGRPPRTAVSASKAMYGMRMRPRILNSHPQRIPPTTDDSHRGR